MREAFDRFARTMRAHGKPGMIEVRLGPPQSEWTGLFKKRLRELPRATVQAWTVRASTVDKEGYRPRWRHNGQLLDADGNVWACCGPDSDASTYETTPVENLRDGGRLGPASMSVDADVRLLGELVAKDTPAQPTPVQTER